MDTTHIWRAVVTHLRLTGAMGIADPAYSLLKAHFAGA
jgi:hypothetical protein